uniref:Uncharacterized protein n=1 Tax=Lepisosteus oculatus TaxID=7918 RepID=W5LWE5_LEPOC
IRSASRMSGGIVVFLQSTDLANTLVKKGVVLDGTFTPLLPLAACVMRNELLERELSRYGQVVSPIRRVPLGCRAPQLKHVVSCRRQVYVILKKTMEEINVALKFRIDSCDYVVFVTSEHVTCASGSGETEPTAGVQERRSLEGAGGTREPESVVSQAGEQTAKSGPPQPSEEQGAPHTGE